LENQKTGVKKGRNARVRKEGRPDHPYHTGGRERKEPKQHLRACDALSARLQRGENVYKKLEGVIAFRKRVHRKDRALAKEDSGEGNLTSLSHHLEVHCKKKEEGGDQSELGKSSETSREQGKKDICIKSYTREGRVKKRRLGEFGGQKRRVRRKSKENYSGRRERNRKKGVVGCAEGKTNRPLRSSPQGVRNPKEKGGVNVRGGGCSGTGSCGWFRPSRGERDR